MAATMARFCFFIDWSSLGSVRATASDQVRLFRGDSFRDKCSFEYFCGRSAMHESVRARPRGPRRPTWRGSRCKLTGPEAARSSPVADLLREATLKGFLTPDQLTS